MLRGVLNIESIEIVFLKKSSAMNQDFIIDKKKAKIRNYFLRLWTRMIFFDTYSISFCWKILCCLSFHDFHEKWVNVMLCPHFFLALLYRRVGEKFKILEGLQ